MARFFIAFYLCILCLGVTAQQMTSNGNVRTNPRTLVTIQNEQVLHGADLYFEHCSVCHGDTALGLAEAKTTFPEEHRKCTHCHKSNNTKLIDWRYIEHNNMFDIGKPGALRGDLSSFPSALTLYTYIKVTMPRYEPDKLSGDDYMAITAFLAHINGASLEATPLTEQSAAGVSLSK